MRINKDNVRFFLRVTLFSSLIFSALSVFAEVPTSFVFVSLPQTIAVGAVSETITLQTQNATGNSVVLPQTGCLSLKSTSSSGQFSSSASNWNPVSVLTMNKGTANRNFYYKNTSTGTQTISVQAVLKPETENRSCSAWPVSEWPEGSVASQSLVVGGSGADNTANSANQNSNATTTSGSTNNNNLAENTSLTNNTNSSWPVEPQIYSHIKAPKIALAGADVTFVGEVVGADGEPIVNSRLLWNFGDGSVKEGKSVLHAYNFPGDYVVILEASSGKYDGSSRVTVKVIPADISIAGVISGLEGKIDLVNGSNQELDLSWWRIGSNGKFFTIPKNTKILPNGRLTLSAVVMGISIETENLSLLYPNGSVAKKYEDTKSSGPIVPTVVDDSKDADIPVVPVAESADERTFVPVAKIDSKQVASAIASTEEVALDAVSSEAVIPENTGSGPSVWFYATVGVIILGLAFVMLPKYLSSSDVTKGSEANSFEIIED